MAVLHRVKVLARAAGNYMEPRQHSDGGVLGLVSLFSAVLAELFLRG